MISRCDPSITSSLSARRDALRQRTLLDEATAVRQLRATIASLDDRLTPALQIARNLVTGARARESERSYFDSFLQEFGLSNPEGVALMCLAESLLRIPDDATADRLIAEKLAAGDWSSHSGESTSIFVNASTWGLMLSGRMIDLDPEVEQDTGGWLRRLTRRMGEPVVRQAMRRAMKLMGGEFVVGRTIEEALRRAASDEDLGLCSFDMLGEGARTDADAQRYLSAYELAIDAIGAQMRGRPLHAGNGISIKLSALEPSYSLLKSNRVHMRLTPRALELARRAAQLGIGLTLDAEEADRLDISLDVIETLMRDPATLQWPGLGLAVQAYGKRAPDIIEWVVKLARSMRRRITVRLVKGAYWDSEVKRAQERGLSGYPVYTRKISTDIAYLACAARLFVASDVVYPQFASHNALTIAAILKMRPAGAAFEFQRLHGMGRLLYSEAARQIEEFPPVRVYAPVGAHEDLLAYLVRRLLENGANTSFVNRFMDADVPVDTVVQDPVAALDLLIQRDEVPHPHVPLPSEMYMRSGTAAAARLNSRGLDFGDPLEISSMLASAEKQRVRQHVAAPIIGGKLYDGATLEVRNPSLHSEVVGVTRNATAAEISTAFDRAAEAFASWDAAGGAARAIYLDRAADLLEERRAEFLDLLVREAGKTWPDAVAEVREAIDYLRYYALLARQQFAEPLALPGPTGERNTLSLHGRGVFACISPWNFPLAIFLGQVSAALAAGNTVIAKPAAPTTLIAAAAVRLMHEAAVPVDALQFVPAAGRLFGDVAFRHAALAGVALTGSTATANTINRLLAARDGAIVPLIAETGGLNAMIVDSTALPEQVVDDAIASAFASAGQRCSALRLLFVQEEIADRVVEMLKGAMDELIVGDPHRVETDVGPVITDQAAKALRAHAARMAGEARILKVCKLDGRHAGGTFFPPTLIELNHAKQLTHEEFGPILHLCRYRAEQLQDVLKTIRESGFALTLGVQTRIDSVWREIFRGTSTGNTYVNRNMIGAVVGVQPFGGNGLSGTGPKAGGPHYLQRFAIERTLTVNETATGGNVALLRAIEE